MRFPTLQASKLKLLDKAFLISIVLGPASAYSSVYLFHIILFLKYLKSTVKFITTLKFRYSKFLRWDKLVLIFFLLWYILSISWSINSEYAIRYCVYVAILVSIIFYTLSISSTEEKLRTALRILAIVYLIQLVISCMEGLGIVRMPFSPYSPYRHWFGRTSSDLSTFSDTAVQMISRTPTGFLGNPNNLSATLVLILPFFLFYRSKLVALAGSLAILFVVVAAGSRAAALAYLASLFIAILFYAKLWMRVLAVMIVASAIVFGFGLSDWMAQSENARIAEIGSAGMAVRDMITGLESGQNTSSDERQNSSGVRATLILNGWNALVESSGLGVGAGGSQAVQEIAGGQVGDVGSMHNFWFEILVDGGVVFAAIFAAWYLSVIWRVWRISRRSNSGLIRYVSRAEFVGLTCFIIGAIGPSSVVYLLPVWLMVGLALAAIRLEAVRRENLPETKALPAAAN